MDLGSYHVVGAWYRSDEEPFTIPVWRALREVLLARFGLKGSNCSLSVEREAADWKPVKLGRPSLKPDGLDSWLASSGEAHPGWFAGLELQCPKWSGKAFPPMLYVRATTRRMRDGALVEPPVLIVAAEDRSSADPLAHALEAVAVTKPSGTAYMRRAWGSPYFGDDGVTVTGFSGPLSATFFGPESLRDRVRGWKDLPNPGG